MKEGESGFLKKIVTAGLVLIGGELYAQDFNHWIVVTPEEFKRRKLESPQVDTVDMRQGDAPPLDNSKVGRVYSDRNGNTFYWINTHPVVEHDSEEVSVVESKKIDLTTIVPIEETKGDELDQIVDNPEMKNIIERFKNEFLIDQPYAIDPKTKKKFYIFDQELTHYIWKRAQDQENIPPEGQLLSKKENSKSVLISKKENNSLWTFLTCLSIRDIKSALSLFLSMQDKQSLSLKEKVSFIKPFFTDLVDQAIENLPPYEAPQFERPELKLPPGKDLYEKKGEPQLKETKPSEINMDDKSLEEILKDE